MSFKKVKCSFPWILVPFSFELTNIQMLDVMIAFSNCITMSCYSVEECFVLLTKPFHKRILDDMPWSRALSKHLKIGSNCLVTKCKYESRDTLSGYLCRYWGMRIFNVFIIKYCQIFLVREISMHKCTADYFS